jgi:hypothetical protein
MYRASSNTVEFFHCIKWGFVKSTHHVDFITLTGWRPMMMWGKTEKKSKKLEVSKHSYRVRVAHFILQGSALSRDPTQRVQNPTTCAGVVEERRASSPQGLGLALRDLLELADRQLVEAADPQVRVGEVASQPVLARPGVAHHGDHLRGGEGGGGGEGGAALLMRGVGRPLR